MTDDDQPRFPATGRSADDVIAAMRGGRADDADWRAGRTFSLVYNPVDPELERLQEAVAHEYLHENYLNPFAFPSLLRMEREVVAMGADLVHGNPRGGKLTSGGTESLFLAVQVAPRPRPHGARHRRAHHRPAVDGAPGLRQGVPLPGRGRGARARRARRPGGRRRHRGRGRRAHRPRGRLGALLPLRRRRPDRRAGGAGGGARRAVPRRCLPRRLAAAVPRAAGRAAATVGLPGRGRDLVVGRHPQVRVVLQGCVAAPPPRRGHAAAAVLPVRRLAGWPVRVGDDRGDASGGTDRGGVGHDHPPRPGGVPPPGRRGAGARRRSCATASPPSPGCG